MPGRRWVRLVAAACTVAAMLVGTTAVAEEASVSLQVGGTTLEVTGQTTPAGFVTISRDGSVIGTTVADANGDFGRLFSAQEPGIHQISVYAHTIGGADTDTVTVNANFTEQATTTVHIFLPPTVVIEDSTLDAGQALQLSGEATPSCTVTVFIDNTNYATTTSDNAGNWSLSISTNGLASGEHSLFVRLNNSFGQQSYPTSARTFSTAPSATPPDTPSPPGEIPTPPTTRRPPNRPVITFPTPGTIWTDPNITVTGTADPSVQVELWDSTSNLSSVWSGQGNWSLRLNLVPKDYALRARACSQGICSDFSDTITFSYQPGTAIPGIGALELELPQSSFIVYQSQPLRLLVIIKGGQPPFSATVTWDDGTTTTYNATINQLNPEHIYTKTGQFTGKIEVKDQAGRSGNATFTVDVWSEPSMLLPWLVVALLILILIAIALVFVIRRKRRNDSDNRSANS